MFIIRFSCGFSGGPFFFLPLTASWPMVFIWFRFIRARKSPKSVGKGRPIWIHQQASPAASTGLMHLREMDKGIRSGPVWWCQIELRRDFYFIWTLFVFLSFFFNFYIDMFLSLLVPRRRLDSSVRFAAHMNSPPNLKNNQIDERHVTSYANVVHTHTHICRDHHFSRSKSLVRLSDEFYSFSRFA